MTGCQRELVGCFGGGVHQGIDYIGSTKDQTGKAPS
jgi:hypothetical protein